MEALERDNSGQPIHYPDGDGEPVSDNTRQFRWIVILKENLDARLPDFVAGDLLWYPVEGQPKIRIGPDVLVALGRPKGDRGSYKQWEEDGVAPQVVFEILSPRNTMAEMVRKGHFFAQYGVREFYAYDPDDGSLYGWTVEGGQLTGIEEMDGWTSPLLGIRFDLSGDELIVYDREGQPFWSVAELEARAREAEQRAETAEQRAETAEQRAGSAEQRAETAEQRAETAEQRAGSAEQRAARLAARLRAMGIDPDQALEE